MNEVFNVQTIITLLTIVFSAGIVYAKLNNMEKRLDKMDSHAEHIAVLNSRIEQLEKLLN